LFFFFVVYRIPRGRKGRKRLNPTTTKAVESKGKKAGQNQNQEDQDEEQAPVKRKKLEENHEKSTPNSAPGSASSKRSKKGGRKSTNKFAVCRSGLPHVASTPVSSLTPEEPKVQVKLVKIKCPGVNCKEDFTNLTSHLLIEHFFTYHLNQAVKLSKSSHSFKCKAEGDGCNFVTKLTVSSIQDAAKDTTAGHEMAKHWLTQHCDDGVKKIFEQDQGQEEESQSQRKTGKNKQKLVNNKRF
jgi:hypothetical protein